MPTRLDTNFARLTDPDEFESMVRDICAREWGDPNTAKYGRSGQKQTGVDVYGQPKDLDGVYRGAQCKLRTTDAPLTEAHIENEVKEARSFPHKLDTLILVTDAPRDTDTQILVDTISQRELSNGNFKVAIWFWDAVTERLAAYPPLIVKYYADYFSLLTTLSIVERLIDRPLEVLFFKLASSGTLPLEEFLRLRGVGILNQDALTMAQQTPVGDDFLPDGVICQYVSSPELEDSNLLRFASQVRAYIQQSEKDCPIFVILPTNQEAQFLHYLKSLGGGYQRIHIVANEFPISELAQRILGMVFDYGYRRRGSLPTIEIAARTIPAYPSVALLDLNWQSRLSTTHFPAPEVWEEVLLPAVKDITEKVTTLTDKARLQIASTLPLPAALALGFFLNLRVARIGVWARRAGANDFKQQFWLSDNESAEMELHPKQLTQARESPQTAIVELTTFKSIHKPVEQFARQANLNPDTWLEIPLDAPVNNITEGVALAYANQVGGIIRSLNAQGVTDIHLFARMPSALGVLVGQRLQACGRLHLYWFDNPTYHYAFTLK